MYVSERHRLAEGSELEVLREGERRVMIGFRAVVDA